jgi:hypothetical protein
MARIRPRTEVRSGPSTVNGFLEAPFLATGAPKASPSGAEGSGIRQVNSDGVLAAQDAVVVGVASEPYWTTIDAQLTSSTYPHHIDGLKAAHFQNGTGYVAFIEDCEGAGNDLVATNVATYDDAADRLTIASNPGGKEIRFNHVLSAEADWQLRTSGDGVVWYHDFRNEDEVNNFRWTTGGGGNDPEANGSENRRADWCRHITNDGVTGGGCLELFREAGSMEASGWWRPFSAITGGGAQGSFTGNGRGVDDPGANGTLQVYSDWDANTGSMMGNWDRSWYGHPSYWDANPGKYEGESYYLQCRVKVNSAREVVERVEGGNPDGGKLFFFTLNNTSAPDQELVTTNRRTASGTQTPNMFNMYRQRGIALTNDGPGVNVWGNHPNTEWGTVGDGMCFFSDSEGRRANCWNYNQTYDEWFTILYKITPGRHQENETRVEVWAAIQGETEYTKIFDHDQVSLSYNHKNAHNALICSSYWNGYDLTEDISNRFDQIIFSKEFIPCPNDPVQRGEA